MLLSHEDRQTLLKIAEVPRSQATVARKRGPEADLKS